MARWVLEAGAGEAAGLGMGAMEGKVGKGKAKKKVLVSVEDISAGTWIAEEDVVGVLREMGVCEVVARKAGRGGGRREDEDVAAQRVRIDKKAVRSWMRDHGAGMEDVIDVDGFVEGYGFTEASDVEMAD